jgi:phosphatidylglycerophosphatase C
MESQLKEGHKLALFDFDGTLTRTDTMFAFIQYAKGQSKLFSSFLALSPYLILHRLGLYNTEKAKKRLLSYHFRGMSQEELQRLGMNFCLNLLPTLFRDEALEKLHFHRSKGHTVYIVTASLDLWVQPWLDLQGLPGICTRIAWEEGRFMGEFVGTNCNGPEKARRILEAVDLKRFERVYAYGDSKGDKEMMALAHRSFYRSFL